MKCAKCGADIPEGAKKCPVCEASSGESFAEKMAEMNNTKDTTGDFDSEDVFNNKGMAILSYLSWLVLIPIFAAKNSRFARFHANQGLVLVLCETVWGIICGVTSAVLNALYLWPLSVLLGLSQLVFVLLAVLGIVNAAQGKAKELPVIGKIHILD